MPDTINLKPILSFLDELSQHNDRVWFDQHRPAYDAAKDTFEQFIDMLIDEFRVPDRLHDLSARHSVARIYRDIRFSKDKSPYKTNMAAMIAPGGWKPTRLGYYVSLSPQGQSMVAGGLYDPTTEQLNRFRQVIAKDASAFRQVTSARDFVEVFGAVEGDRLKTAPKGYDRSHPDIALLQLKQIVAMRHFSDREVLADDFADQVVTVCRTMKPFLEYLDELSPL